MLLAPLQSSLCVGYAQHHFSILDPQLWELGLDFLMLWAELQDT